MGIVYVTSLERENAWHLTGPSALLRRRCGHAPQAKLLHFDLNIEVRTEFLK
jgi:hypothetical protein